MVVYFSYNLEARASVLVEALHIEDIFNLLTKDFPRQLVFAGVIDDRAKLLHFQKGKIPLVLPIDRQNALDVQLSLVWTISKQLEDFTGPLAHTVLTFTGSEVILVQISTKLMLYIICTTGSSADILDALTNLIKQSSKIIDDYVEHEWYGQ